MKFYFFWNDEWNLQNKVFTMGMESLLSPPVRRAKVSLISAVIQKPVIRESLVFLKFKVSVQGLQGWFVVQLLKRRQQIV